MRGLPPERWLLPLLVACVLGLQGCGLALIGAAGSAAFSIAEDRRTSGLQLADETSQLRVRSRIADRFGDRSHVSVTVFNRMALLTGEAPDETTRDEMSKIALGVPDIRAVTNEVQIAGVSTAASRLSDEVVTSKLKARLIDSGKVSPVHVKVVTEAGVVYLLGMVTQTEAENAVAVARTTGGVKKVVKVFEYCDDRNETCRADAKSAPARPE